MACYRRRKGILILLSVLLAFFEQAHDSFAQNLVPNPSFEKVIKAPCNLPVTSSGGVQEYVYEWYTPTQGTSDIFIKDTIPQCSASMNNYKRSPRTGRFCAGIYTSGITNLNETDGANIPDYKEYLQIKLRSPLTKNRVYYFEYYVLFRENSSFASNNLGALFTAEPVSTTGSQVPYGTINRRPQVNHTEIVTNSTTWTKISGCFQATEPYQYLTIGNFFTNTHTKYQKTIWLTGLEPYYWIDDISLTEIEVEKLPVPPILGADTSVCAPKSVLFDLTKFEPFKPTWQDGSHTVKYEVDRSGQYFVSLSYLGCEVRDTVHVDAWQPISLGPDIRTCIQTEIQIGTQSGQIAKWSDGTEAVSIVVDNSGEYFASSISSDCPSSDTVKVEMVACPGKIPNVFTPNGDGVNDLFVIDNIELTPWRLEIYNRWGKLIYKDHHYRNTWDGSDYSSGMYYITLESEELKKSYKGWINILR